MTDSPPSQQQLLAENAALRTRLSEAEETLRAIQGGEADAIMMSGPEGERIHTLPGSLEPYRVMVEAMSEGAVTLARDGAILYCNSRFAAWVKLPREQITGMALQGMVAKQDKKRFDAMLPQGSQEVIRETLTLQAHDGTQTPALFSMSPLPQSEGKVISVVIADLSEVVAAAAARSRLALIVDSSDDAIVSITLDGVVDSWNPAAEQLFGYSAAEAIGRPLQTLIISPEHADKVAGRLDVVLRGEHTGRLECMQRRKDGSLVEVSVTYFPIFDHAGMVVGASINTRDITERKAGEEKLRLNSQLLDSSADSIMAFDFEGNFIYLNEAAWKTRGYTHDELMAMNLHVLDVPEYEKFVDAKIGELMEKGADVFEAAHRRKDGSIMPIEVTSSMIESNGQKIIITASRDITERKQAEEALRRANRALKTLSAGNLALVRAEDEDSLLQSITSVIAQQGGYSLAVVYYAEDDPQRSLTPMAWSGAEGGGYLAEQLSWADTERGQLPVSRAIRSGITQVSHNVASDPSFNPWREGIQAHGYQANIALPLRSAGKNFGGLSIYSSDANAFDAEEIPLLEELANDLAYGIITLRARVEQSQHAFILQQSLEQSIQTIADTVEARDPYTAGHQRRVSELATAIARGMGLPEEQIHGIHLAGIVHDLGKIHVPAEILSKPGKLTKIEYMLIQQHPQEGYDILKNVVFPWPIADIVLQHHERLDGSGYPQGLKGDAILLEARIMAVADVVEAMSSHRPYRPGLGIDAALEEITHMRGTHYDPQVVDACVALFKEKQYVIPD